MNLSTLIELALAEDAVRNDLTAAATLAADQLGSARITAKAAGILSGVGAADAVFAAVDSAIVCDWQANDAEHVQSGDLICTLRGPLRALLAAERSALNFLQRLSGIATATRAFADALEGTGCRVADTRKTTPGFRALEKQAVIHGGGVNHRLGLQSGMLIKENHIEACGSISAAIAACKRLNRDATEPVWIEVECETMDEVNEAVAAEPDMILLDNMTPADVTRARALVPASILLEASGNITLANARAYAATGVDRIAIGAITHSAPALDLSMRIDQR